jgi:hypothetical protein
MEIDPDKLKDAMTGAFENLRKLETELMAYQSVIQLLKLTNVLPEMPWDKTLDAARKNPALLKVMDDKYKPLVDDLLRSIDLAELQGKVLELLRQWKPSGPVN